MFIRLVRCKTPREKRNENQRVDEKEKPHHFNFILIDQLLLKTQNTKLESALFKIAKKLFKDKIMSETSETIPIDFAGAARSDGEPAIKYISRDEDERMKFTSTCSLDDLYLTSEAETERYN